MQILFVCLTNLSLSPLFEASMRRRCSRSAHRRRRNATVESAGLMRSTSGMPANELVAEAARRHGLDMSRHRARFVGDIGALSRFDAIVCRNMRETCIITDMLPKSRARRVFCLKPARGAYMPHSAYSPDEAEEMFEIVFRCAGTIARVILP
jgi:protein-tyrosine phosphatase